MSDQEPLLLQAVLDKPDDDAPRLVYADWCAQQPDELTRARAELIRAQIEMLQPDYQSLDRVEQYRISSRAAELLTAHRQAWAGPLVDLVGDYGYQRGFVFWVQTSASRFLANADRLFALAPIAHTDITAMRDVSEEFFASQHLRQLRSLLMDNCGLYDIHLQLLADSPHVTWLRWLSVANNHLGMKGAEALAASKNLPFLRFVEFGGNPVDPTEQLGVDGGIIVASVFPQAGMDLEARYGVLPWLHRDQVVQRFAQ
jgi:uncharacterized protein (TIGR02996 family)